MLINKKYKYYIKQYKVTIYYNDNSAIIIFYFLLVYARHQRLQFILLSCFYLVHQCLIWYFVSYIVRYTKLKLLHLFIVM